MKRKKNRKQVSYIKKGEQNIQIGEIHLVNNCVDNFNSVNRYNSKNRTTRS